MNYYVEGCSVKLKYLIGYANFVCDRFDNVLTRLFVFELRSVKTFVIIWMIKGTHVHISAKVYTYFSVLVCVKSKRSKT